MKTFYQRLKFIMRIYDQDDVLEQVKNSREKVKNNQVLTELEQQYLELPAFLERIDVFFQPQMYAKRFPTLFQHRKAPYSQQAEKVFFLEQPESLIPKETSQSSGIIRSNYFTGTYDKVQLDIYCALLKSKIEEMMSFHHDQVVAMALKILDHAFMIAYENDRWILFNPTFYLADMESEAGNAPYCVVKNAEEMAQKIAKACTRLGEEPSPVNSFSTELYVTDTQLAEEIAQGMQLLSAKKEWQDIHPIDIKSVMLVASPLQSDRLTIAAKIGDVLLLKELMKQPSFTLDKAIVDSILFVALSRGHEEFVLQLLEMPIYIDFDKARYVLDRYKAVTFMQVAEDTHSQRVMIRAVERKVKTQCDPFSPMSQLTVNILTALRLYLVEQSDPIVQRETVINNIVKLLNKSIDSYEVNNDDKIVEKCMKTLQDIVLDVKADHATKFPEKLPRFLHSFAHAARPSKLAMYLQEALDKKLTPSSPRYGQ